MKSILAKLASVGLVLVVLTLADCNTVSADETVTLDSKTVTLGFMNVFELDRSGAIPVPGAFVFGSGWGFADLTAVFEEDGTLTLGPNVIGDPNEFWYLDTCECAKDPTNPGGPGQLGNKWMDANGYAEINDDSLAGITVTFTGEVLSHTLTPNHSVRAFIRDFTPDYSAFNETCLELTPTTGVFSIELVTDPGLGRHVQYGFNFQGENVWVTDVGPFGTVSIGAVGAGCILGDLNGDMVVDLFDIAGFVDAVISGEFSCVADVNEDGEVDLGDIAPFVSLLV